MYGSVSRPTPAQILEALEQLALFEQCMVVLPPGPERDACFCKATRRRLELEELKAKKKVPPPRGGYLYPTSRLYAGLDACALWAGGGSGLWKEEDLWEHIVQQVDAGKEGVEAASAVPANVAATPGIPMETAAVVFLQSIGAQTGASLAIPVEGPVPPSDPMPMPGTSAGPASPTVVVARKTSSLAPPPARASKQQVAAMQVRGALTKPAEGASTTVVAIPLRRRPVTDTKASPSDEAAATRPEPSAPPFRDAIEVIRKMRVRKFGILFDGPLGAYQGLGFCLSSLRTAPELLVRCPGPLLQNDELLQLLVCCGLCGMRPVDAETAPDAAAVRKGSRLNDDGGPRYFVLYFDCSPGIRGQLQPLPLARSPLAMRIAHLGCDVLGPSIAGLRPTNHAAFASFSRLVSSLDAASIADLCLRIPLALLGDGGQSTTEKWVMDALKQLDAVTRRGSYSNDSLAERAASQRLVETIPDERPAAEAVLVDLLHQTVNGQDMELSTQQPRRAQLGLQSILQAATEVTSAAMRQYFEVAFDAQVGELTGQSLIQDDMFLSPGADAARPWHQFVGRGAELSVKAMAERDDDECDDSADGLQGTQGSIEVTPSRHAVSRKFSCRPSKHLRKTRTAASESVAATAFGGVARSAQATLQSMATREAQVGEVDTIAGARLPPHTRTLRRASAALEELALVAQCAAGRRRCLETHVECESQLREAEHNSNRIIMQRANQVMEQRSRMMEIRVASACDEIKRREELARAAEARAAEAAVCLVRKGMPVLAGRGTEHKVHEAAGIWSETSSEIADLLCESAVGKQRVFDSLPSDAGLFNLCDANLVSLIVGGGKLPVSAGCPSAGDFLSALELECAALQTYLDDVRSS